MTLKEFMEKADLPISSNRAAAMTWKQAIQHSLNKWKLGDEHKAETYEAIVYINENESIIFGMMNCALCVKSMKETEDSKYKLMCDVCPLKNYTKSCSGNDDQPWGIFVDTGNMKPMISALETCLKEYEE